MVAAWQHDFRYVVFYALALVTVELLVIAIIFIGIVNRMIV